MGLLAHCDTKRTTLDIVKAVPRPEFTKTWRPYSHADVLDAVTGAVEEKGMSVIGGDYSLGKDGAKMFSVLNLDGGSPDGSIGWSVGVRNSINMTLSIGICAGTNVFVCDNLAFSGDFVEFRRHNSTLDDEKLKIVAGRAVDTVVQKTMAYTNWHSGLKTFECDETAEKVLTYDCIKAGAFPASKFHAFRESLKAENDTNPADHRGTLYNFHGGVTRLLKGSSLFRVADGTVALRNVIDEYLTTDPRKAA